MAFIMGKDGEVQVNTAFADIDRGLVGLWRMDYGSGEILYDSSPHGHNADFFGGATWVTGANSKGGDSAVDFDGANDYARTRKKYNLTNFTLCAWVRWDAGESAAAAVIISNYSAGGSDSWFSIYMTAADVLEFAFDDGTTNDVATGTTELDDGSWHFVVVVFDSTNAIARVYVDGLQEGTNDPLGESGVTSTNYLYFGTDTTLAQKWNGVIDEARLYSRALTAAEIYFLYEHPDGHADDKAFRMVADSWSASLQADLIETTPFGVNSKEFIYGMQHATGSISGTLDAGERVAIDGNQEHQIVLAGTGENGGLGMVIRSNDQGATWFPVYDASKGISDDYIRSLTYMSQGKALFGTGNAEGLVMLSNDLGLTWAEAYDASVQIAEVDIYAMEYLENGIVLGGTANAPYIIRSTDYGATWAALDIDALTGSASTDVRCIEYLGNGIVLAGGGTAAGDAIVWRSTDYGATWTDININTAVAANTADIVLSMTYCGSGVVFAGCSEDGANEPRILKSTDYGATWVSNYTVTGEDEVHSVEYLGLDTVIAGTGNVNGKIYRTTNLGTAWTDLGQQDSQDRVSCMECIDMAAGIAIAGTYNDAKIRRSTDRGATWSTVYEGNTNLGEEEIHSMVGCGMLQGEQLANIIRNLRKVYVKLIMKSGNYLYLRVLVSSIEIGSPVGGKSTFTLNWQSDSVTSLTTN